MDSGRALSAIPAAVCPSFHCLPSTTSTLLLPSVSIRHTPTTLRNAGLPLPNRTSARERLLRSWQQARAAYPTRCTRTSISKYSPAKPGALDLEPFKAAVGECHGSRSLLFHRAFTGSRRAISPLSPHALTKRASIAGLLRLRGSFPCERSINARDSLLMISLRPGVLLEMSNFYCHPGRAGGSPMFG